MEIGYKIITCGGDNCGITYAVPEVWYNEKRRTYGSFTCPNGCRRKFTAENEEDKLRRENERFRQNASYLEETLQQTKDQRDSTERRLRATKAVVTRTKKRIGNGTCPCCHRSFRDLHLHMDAKHPEYAKGGAVH